MDTGPRLDAESPCGCERRARATKGVAGIRKTPSCTFTLNAASSETANVQ